VIIGLKMNNALRTIINFAGRVTFMGLLCRVFTSDYIYQNCYTMFYCKQIKLNVIARTHSLFPRIVSVQYNTNSTLLRIYPTEFSFNETLSKLFYKS
jgi:hypothetical protein